MDNCRLRVLDGYEMVADFFVMKSCEFDVLLVLPWLTQVEATLSFGDGSMSYFAGKELKRVYIGITSSSENLQCLSSQVDDSGTIVESRKFATDDMFRSRLDRLMN